MSISNRSGKIEKLYKTLKKYYTENPIAGDRTVLDLLLYACCLENDKYDDADEAFARLQQSYHDLNEVRVTTVIELSEEVFNNLSDPKGIANRVKTTLHSMYENRYAFDLEDMRKTNLGKAVAEIESWQGTTSYMVSFVTQNALGGHSIPVSKSCLDFFEQAEIITAAEASKKSVPGLERTIAKSKGPEFASLLHQFIIEWSNNPKSATVQTVCKALGVQATPKAKEAAATKTPAKAKPKSEKPAASKATASSSTTKSKTAAKKTTSSKAAPAKKTASKKSSTAASTKKTAAKKTAAKKKATKKTTKSSSSASTKRKKPR